MGLRGLRSTFREVEGIGSAPPRLNTGGSEELQTRELICSGFSLESCKSMLQRKRPFQVNQLPTKFAVRGYFWTRCHTDQRVVAQMTLPCFFDNVTEIAVN